MRSVDFTADKTPINPPAQARKLSIVNRCRGLQHAIEQNPELNRSVVCSEVMSTLKVATKSLIFEVIVLKHGD
jgi:hypothetical protein